MVRTSERDNEMPHDGACTNCRTRKIRCGREKPGCKSCYRDQVECVYSSPPKRVNHIKVLCQNFDDIQDRLIKMQGELSWLTAALKKSNFAGQYKPNLNGDLTSVGAFKTTYSGDTTAPPTPTGHVIRDCGTQIERHYGPWTLVALCRQFEADLAACQKGSTNDLVNGLIEKMLLDATTIGTNNVDVDHQSENSSNIIFLPPKQLLLVMLESFLKEPDYNTDIFCRQTIYEAVERVYKDPLCAASEPWALCFNLIILLTFSVEHPLHKEDPFVQPMLHAAFAAVRKPSFFMSPRLINIQTLALFSLLAQQYLTENGTLGDSLFAQACMLARESGLHQAGYHAAPSSNLSATEVEERQKVFKSLYIRDRYSAITCGTLLWLSSGGPRSSPLEATSNLNEQCAPSSQHYSHSRPHWELAKLQDELIRVLNFEDSPEVSASERPLAFARLKQKIENWTRTYKALLSTRPTTLSDVSLHLAFIGTCIRLQDSEHTTSDAVRLSSAQMLHDARLSCVLLATSCNRHPDDMLVSQLDNLLNKREITCSGRIAVHSAFKVSSPTLASSSSSATSSIVDSPKRTELPTPPLSRSSPIHAPVSAPLPFHRLVNVFPITAIFVLARQVLGIDVRAQPSQSALATSQNDEHWRREINQDILILEALLSCIPSVTSSATEAIHGNVRKEASGFNFGCMLKHLIDIVHTMTNLSGCGKVNSMPGSCDDMDVYAPEPLLPSTSPLLLDSSSGAISMPKINLFGSGAISPSHLGFPSSSSQFMWGLPQKSTRSSMTPVLTAGGSSSYAPSIAPTPPTLSETPSDFSHFLQQMGASSPVMWDDGQAQFEFHIEPQQGQYASETAEGRSKKRLRTENSENQDERSGYIRGVA